MRISPRFAFLAVSLGFLSVTLSGADRLVLEVNDQAVLNPLNESRVKLTGRELELRFTGRIAPHENSVFAILGPDVKAAEGRFDRVVLPEGWRGDVHHDSSRPQITVTNLRPGRAPAFPGAEGFGKYTIGGRGGRVI